jgi:AraC family transcriptional regulator of arabinose operon
MLEQGCQQSFTVTELARFAKLSSSRFAALFKQEVGCSPLQFQYACRMKRASELLKLTGLTVQEIAARVGYDDPLHFSRRFKAYFGKAPRFYRQVDSG